MGSLEEGSGVVEGRPEDSAGTDEPTTSDAALAGHRVVTIEPAYEVAAEEVQFEAAGMTVHGTLTRPKGEGPFPALMLIAGSGPTDRNWESALIPGKNGSARLLAEELGRHGVVVLRYDKRGTGETGLPESMNWDDYLAEQRAGLALLRADEAVDSGRIVVAGHSEGGSHALKLAGEPGGSLSGVMLLCTFGSSMLDLLVEQMGDQMRRNDAEEETVTRRLAGFRTAAEQIIAGEKPDPSLVEGDIGLWAMIYQLQQPIAQEFINAILPWNPLGAFKTFSLPVLIISGGKDIQVKPYHDAELLEQAAEEAGLRVTRADITDADHVLKLEEKPFEEITAADALNYNAEERQLNPRVVEEIVNWLRLHVPHAGS